MDKKLKTIKRSLLVYACYVIIMALLFSGDPLNLLKGTIRGGLVIFLLYLLFKKPSKLSYWAIYLITMLYAVTGIGAVLSLFFIVISEHAGAEFLPQVLLLVPPVFLVTVAAGYLSQKGIRDHFTLETKTPRSAKLE